MSGKDKFDNLHNRVSLLGKDIDSLLESAENYIKRTLYTSQKQQELEKAKEKIVKVKELEEKITFVLGIYTNISDNIEKSQYHTAVLLFKFVEEKGLVTAMNVPEFAQIYNTLKKRAETQLNE